MAQTLAHLDGNPLIAGGDGGKTNGLHDQVIAVSLVTNLHVKRGCRRPFLLIAIDMETLNSRTSKEQLFDSRGIAVEVHDDRTVRSKQALEDLGICTMRVFTLRHQ